MNVLFCGGSPKSGSWKMRGVQIAEAGGWVHANVPTVEQIKSADVVVVVKRFTNTLIGEIRRQGKTLVYDILDFWPQNSDAPKDLADGMLLVKDHIAKIQPDAIITANKCMANDLTGCAKHVGHIYHHYRLDARLVSGGSVIYYDGDLRQLGKWGIMLERHAKENGYKFAVGKPQDDAAALFSARTNNLSMRWKSNVKAANAHGYGIPLISRPENSVIETHPYALLYDSDEELGRAVLSIADAPIDTVMRQNYSLGAAIRNYREFLECL